MTALSDLTMRLRREQNKKRAYAEARDNAFGRRSTFQSRIRKLDSIRRDFGGKLESHAEEVLKRQKEIKNKLGDAVRENAHSGELEEAFVGDFVQPPFSDGLCVQMISEVDAEIARCQAELDRADADYSQAVRNINTTSNNISAINKQIKEEKSKNGK